MDLTSTVRTDTLPAVASVLVPGAVVTTPYACLLIARFPQLKNLATQHEAATLAFGALSLVGFGFLVESVGSYVEYYIIDSRHKNRDDMLRKWRLYLRTAWRIEPVGQSYARRMAAVFKFELNTFMALVFATPAVARLMYLGFFPTPVTLWSLVWIVLASYLLHAASQTSILLADVRDLLMEGVTELPAQEKG